MTAAHNGTDAWRNARRVLCVRLDNIGDVLMTTPALRALRHALPGRRLTLLTSRAAATLAPHLADVDEVIAHEASWVRNTAADSVDADLALIDTLRAGRFDAAVIFTVYSQSPLPAALSCRLARIPLRLAHCRENPYHLLSDWVRETEPAAGVRHETQRQLDLVATIGAHCSDTRLAFAVCPGNRQRCAARLARLGIADRAPWILVHPGATAPSRRYPAEAFAEAVRGLWQRLGLPIVIGGDADEAGLIEEIRARAAVPAR
ncbi:MAG: glycosyl transferase, partial [Pseudomonadota bacterium]